MGLREAVGEKFHFFRCFGGDGRRAASNHNNDGKGVRVRGCRLRLLYEVGKHRVAAEKEAYGAHFRFDDGWCRSGAAWRC